MEEILKKIYDFADQAHGEQLRKYTPDRYMVHPLRVMEICKAYTNDSAMLSAALLHDVLEDTPVTREQLLDFLNGLMDYKTAGKALKLVVEMTDVYVKSAYPVINRLERKTMEADRIKSTSGPAQTIKYADILDNCGEIVEYDRHFAPVFLRECLQLLNVMDKGNQTLKQEALWVVTNGMVRLRGKS